MVDVVKASRDFSKTIKNANRFREVLSVFAKNGFDELIQRTKLPERISGYVLPRSSVKKVSGLDLWGSLGYRLRLSFEELGPGFIKIGQLIASREDIFETSFIEELKPLQTQVQGIEFKVAKKIIEQSLDEEIENIFSNIKEEALATASIGSVYEAKLLSGEEVVVKVRKPGIKETLEIDFELFKFLISKIENISEEFKFLGLSRAIGDFYKTIQLELNFNLEKNNLEKLKTNLAKIDHDELLYIPRVYDEYCSERVLVMQKLNGVPFSSLKSSDVTNDLQDKLVKCTHFFLHTILSDGFFHADLHGGNFFLLNSGKIGLIDFGSMGYLSLKNKGSLVSILYALTKNNFDHLVYEFLEIAEYEEIPHIQNLARDLQQSLSPFIGLSSQKIDTSLLTKKLMNTLMKHRMFLPREWYVIFRAIISLDGVGRSIGVDINAFDILEKSSSKLIKKLFSKEQLMEEGFWFGRDILSTMRIVPRHLSWFFKEVSKNNYALEIKNTDLSKSLDGVAKSIQVFSLTVLVCFFMGMGGYFAMVPVNTFSELSRLSILFFVFAVLLSVFLFRFSLKVMK